MCKTGPSPLTLVLHLQCGFGPSRMRTLIVSLDFKDFPRQSATNPTDERLLNEIHKAETCRCLLVKGGIQTSPSMYDHFHTFIWLIWSPPSIFRAKQCTLASNARIAVNE